jgi:hypothetical protein
VPALVPPERANEKELFGRPVTAFPVASLTTTVTMSPAPDTSEALAKLTVEFAALTPPVITWTVGFVFRETPVTVAVSVLAVPAVVAVNVVV